MASSDTANKGQKSKPPPSSSSSSSSPPDDSRSDPSDPKSKDPNMSNPRLLINRACIYERRLPGDAYITAHVQRLQHGYYSSPAVSDKDAEHVDFLAISFVFHSPNTISHRFKSATVKAAIEGAGERSQSAHPSNEKNEKSSANPRFLMHAPHLIFGTVSPETMEWTFSLAGSLGISETPVSASVIPSGSVNGRYRRYEMIRIQGSARTRKSPRGPEFDVEAGEVFWSLEENTLQRSGLPREFTFVMLIQKPTPTSKVKLSLEIDPVLQVWYGSYPSWMLSLAAYQPLKRRGIDFRQEVGQRFAPVDEARGFNFAALVAAFDEYIAMPGRKFTRQIPPENGVPDDHIRPSYPGQYGSLNPVQQQPMQQGMPGMQGTNTMALQNTGFSLQNNLLQSQLRQLQYGPQSEDSEERPGTSTAGSSSAAPMPVAGGANNTLNVRLIVENAAASPSKHAPRRSGMAKDTGIQTAENEPSIDGLSLALANHWVDDETRARVLRGKVYAEDSTEDTAEDTRRPRPVLADRAGRGRVMMLANVPLTQSLLCALSQGPQ